MNRAPTSAPPTPPPSPRSVSNDTPREPTWLQADSTLLARLDALEREIGGIVREAVNETIAEQLDPLVAVARAALDRHRGLRDEIPFVDPVTPDEPRDLWRRVCRYRDAVRTQVIAPVREAVEANTGRAITEAFRAAMERAGATGSDLPPEEVMPELPGLFKPDKRDSVVRRGRKAMARVSRKTTSARLAMSNRIRRVLRAPLRPLPPRRRHVPIQDLVAFHVTVRVGQLLADLHRDLLKKVTSRLTVLEDATAAWSNDLLGAEAALDRPEFHGPAVSWLHDLEVADQPEASTERVVELNRAADALERGLASLAESQREDWLRAIDDDLAALSSGLLGDLQLAGTFLLDMRRRQVDAGRARVARALETQSTRWDAFHRELEARFALDHRLFELRIQLIATSEGLLTRITRAAVDPVLETFGTLIEGLRGHRRRVDEIFAAFDAGRDASKLIGELSSVRDRLLDDVRSVLRDLPGLVTAEAALRETGVEEWETIVGLIDDLPERLDVHQRWGESDEERRRRVVDVRLQDIARDALAPPLPLQIRDVSAALRQRVLAVWSRTEQIDDILRYNLDATIEELSGAASNEEDRATALAKAVSAGRELATDGLDRSVGTLVDLSATLRPPWAEFRRVAVETYQEDWSDLHRRVQVDDFLEERWVDLQFWVTRRLEASWRETRARWARGLSTAKRVAGAVQRYALQLIRKGRTVVGVQPADETTLLETVDAIVDVHRLRDQLPLVYRRLFSMAPVQEVALLEGRARDLVRVRDHFRRWRDRHQAGVMVVAGSVGGGITSFVNALDEAVFDGCRVRRLTLTGRIDSEPELARKIADVLEIDLGSEANLEALESELPATPDPTSPLVCIVEDLEHLVLQAPGGSDLLARVLIFLSRADGGVYWVGSVSDQMWRFVDRTAGGASGFVTTMELPPSDRALLEAIIVERHQRTGLPLDFVAPAEPSPILRQRLRRARTPERRQAVLRESFFDRLHRAVGPSVALGIFYWIRSVEFVEDGEAVQVRPLETLDFGFFHGLDLHQTFTLRAFVLHRTLTVDEHTRIFRSTPRASTFVLESLLNLRIIEPFVALADAGASGRDEHQRIVPGERYRIRRLLRQPVVEYLRAKHIIY